MARNNVQPITFKQAKGKKISFYVFALHPGSPVTHPGCLLWAHGRDIMTCEKCVKIFLKAVMFDKNFTHINYLVETHGYTKIFIVVYMPNIL